MSSRYLSSVSVLFFLTKSKYSRKVLTPPTFLEIYSYIVHGAFGDWTFYGSHFSSIDRIVCGQDWIYWSVGFLVATPIYVPLIISDIENVWYSIDMNIGALSNGLSCMMIP